MATFILVHGTFAKSAHWPFLQDRLAETVRAAGDEPLFEQLPWTGRNHARARQAAASAIFALVQRIQRISANEKMDTSKNGILKGELASSGIYDWVSNGAEFKATPLTAPHLMRWRHSWSAKPFGACW